MCERQDVSLSYRSDCTWENPPTHKSGSRHCSTTSGVGRCGGNSDDDQLAIIKFENGALTIHPKDVIRSRIGRPAVHSQFPHEHPIGRSEGYHATMNIYPPRNSGAARLTMCHSPTPQKNAEVEGERYLFTRLSTRTNGRPNCQVVNMVSCHMRTQAG